MKEKSQLDALVIERYEQERITGLELLDSAEAEIDKLRETVDRYVEENRKLATELDLVGVECGYWHDTYCRLVSECEN
jgi:hypothetical protein